MKKFITLLIILAGIVAVYYYKHNQAPASVVPGNTSDKTFKPDARSATFRFDDEDITLSQGKNQLKDESGSVQETFLLDENAYGDLNKDGKEDTVVLMARSGSGSGVFVYVAAYVSGPISYKGTNALFLGDRISPQSIFIANGVATVKFLDRNADEAFAEEPTVPVTKEFVYKNGEFVER
jgi:hypothetical protein